MTVPTPGRPNPYVGPRAFESDERLYGRDSEVLNLRDLLIAERIVLLHSPSGAGKTSLIQAGLLREMKERRFTVLPVVRLNTPTTIESANRYLFSTLETLDQKRSDGHHASPAALASMDLDTYLAGWPNESGMRDVQVLIFDQFEEVLTLDPADLEGKDAFFGQLGKALEHPRRWALFAIREDYLGKLEPYLDLIPTRLSTTFRLDLLGEEAARQAIQEPAGALNVTFTEAAATALVNDLRRVRIQQGGETIEKPGPYVEPVQLQVVCRSLWGNLPPEATEIQVADIAGYGDIDAALATYYAESIRLAMAQAKEANAPVSERTLRDWVEHSLITEQGFRGLVLPGSEGSGSPPGVAIQALIDAHLVRAEQRLNATWYELTHDRLIGPIKRNNLAWREQHLILVQRRAMEWIAAGRPSGLLFDGPLLEEAHGWAAENDADVTPTEREFLKACEALDQANLRERRRNLLLRGLSVIAMLACIAALIFGLLMLRESRVSEEAKSSAQAGATSVAFANVTATLALGEAVNAQATTTIVLATAVVAEKTATSALGLAIKQQTSEAVNAAANAQSTALTVENQTIQRAKEAADQESKARAIALASISNLNVDPERSLLLVLESLKINRTQEGETALRRAIVASRVRTRLDEPSNRMSSAAFAQDDNHVITAGGDGKAMVWDRSRSTRPSPDTAVHLIDDATDLAGVAMSPDGTRAAVVGANGVGRIWNAQTWQPIANLDVGQQNLTSVAFSANSTQLLTTSDDGVVRLWQAANGAAVTTSSGAPVILRHPSAVWGGDFSPDGQRVVTASADRLARIWDATNGTQLSVLEGHGDEVMTAVFSPDGQQVLTASLDATARLWSVDASGMWQTRLVLSGHTYAVASAAFSPDGTRVVTASHDRSARIWDTATGRLVTELRGHTSVVKDAIFNKDGRLVVTASWDGTARVWEWEASTERSVVRPLAHSQPLMSAVFSPTGDTIVTSSWDHIARIWRWQPPADATERAMIAHPGEVWSAAFSPDGQTLVTGDQEGERHGVARVWSWTSDTTQPKHELPHDGVVYTVAWSPVVQHVGWSPTERLIATASGDATVGIWRASTGEPVARIDQHTDQVTSAAFSPTEPLLVTTSRDQTSRVWDLSVPESPRLVALIPDTHWVDSGSFSPDGKLLITASHDGTARVRQVSRTDQWPIVATLWGHQLFVNTAVFSPDGRLVVTASTDRTARVWDTTTWQSIATLTGHTAEVRSAEFSPDGTYIITAGMDNTARIYACGDEACGAVDDIVRLAEGSRLTRSLTEDERQQYLK